MSAALLSETLQSAVAPIWRRELSHPFVRGLADSTLDIECFRFYLRQDYLFLIDYCQVFALAAAKAPDLETIGTFSTLLHDTLHTEMQLHRDYCARLGVSREELERTTPAPVTHAYTRHLLDVAWSGSLAEIAAAVLPCQLGYAEIGTTLARGDQKWQTSRYAEWIRTYASPEFVTSAEKLRGLLDRLTMQWPEQMCKPLHDSFLTSSRYEYLFWEMAWTQAGWPV